MITKSATADWDEDDIYEDKNTEIYIEYQDSMEYLDYYYKTPSDRELTDIFSKMTPSEIKDSAELWNISKTEKVVDFIKDSIFLLMYEGFKERAEYLKSRGFKIHIDE